MATAVVEERQLLKSLRWWDGFVIAMCNPGFMIAFLGFTLDALGTWGAVVLWSISAGIGLLQAFIYCETAAMFPDKPGGISLYAYEGWKSRFSLAGPIGAFGYWIGWSVVLSIFGKTIGDLVIAKWFPSTTWSVYDGVVTHHCQRPDRGRVHRRRVAAQHLRHPPGRLDLVHHRRRAARPSVPRQLRAVHHRQVALEQHDVEPARLRRLQAGDGLSVPNGLEHLRGVEVSASFAPEYKNTKRDTALALRTGATFALLAAVLFPLGMSGLNGAPNPALAEGQFYPAAFARLVGSGGASFVTACLIGSLFLSMISSTADASRALYGIARDDMTVKQLYHLNKHHVPGRAMTVDMVVNTLLILFISSNLAILYMSNIGYVVAHIFALSGFLLLRRDRPNWPRAIKVGPIWVVLAAFFLVVNIAFLVYGAANPTITGYGTYTDLYIGVGVLVGSVVLFLFRRIIQDHKRVTFREEAADMPSPAQMALLEQEVAHTGS